MKKNIHRSILKKAWSITKENKILWFFGIFAALLGNGGEFQILNKAVEKISNINLGVGMGYSSVGNAGVLKFASKYPFEYAHSLLAALIVLGIIVIVIWIVTVSQAALIYGIDKKLKGKIIKYKEGIDLGIEKFVPVFVINCITKMLILACLFIIGLPIISILLTEGFVLDLFMYILIFVVFIPIGIIISFISKYAIAFIVLKNKNVLEAAKLSWDLFMDNWVISIEMAFLLFLINLVVGVAAITIMAIIVFPVATLATVYIASGFSTAALLLLFFVGGINFIVIAMLGALIATFQWASWIGLFRKLTGEKGILSKIDRFFRGMMLKVKASAK